MTQPKPPWLRRRIPGPGRSAIVTGVIEQGGLHTVCQEAHCPNQMECFSRGTATFLLLGPNCTRRCTFCAVDKSSARPPDPDEPLRTADAVYGMGLTFCVLTMVTRDDLPDGGAGHVARTVRAIKGKDRDIGVETLISDLGGDGGALETVLEAEPEVLNHNLETVPRLYPLVRPQADYYRSLNLLARASEYSSQMITKSGLILGLGETREEILQAMDHLQEAGCRLLTLGQYLAPSPRHFPVARYVTPEEFEEYRVQALDRGFTGVVSAPLVRSSYRAEELFLHACHGVGA
ncbi:MAG: lipoyl synthase [Deltaproteobacteria bacterium]|nr:lipoyl synthase [Deltaproteobacteria bacterium]MBW2049473.1 lipoyl synthase [Deltaproteobacteria bacterium]MBW2110908.1 lipoyl synthase [Deltaproteobacteria bacterium]MBW2354191.1 lipoyl synthase [Deltaproteobacteria bacterium]